MSADNGKKLRIGTDWLANHTMGELESRIWDWIEENHNTWQPDIAHDCPEGSLIIDFKEAEYNE